PANTERLVSRSKWRLPVSVGGAGVLSVVVMTLTLLWSCLCGFRVHVRDPDLCDLVFGQNFRHRQRGIAVLLGVCCVTSGHGLAKQFPALGIERLGQGVHHLALSDEASADSVVTLGDERHVV